MLKPACLCVVIALLALPNAAIGQEVEAELPFPVLTGENAPQYAKDAMAFITANPQSPHTPRVILDLYTLSIIAKNMTAADQMRARLVFQYPSTLQAQYIVSTFADAKNYRAFVDRHVAGTTNRDAVVGQPFYNAMKLGLGRFGAIIYQDYSFLIRSALAAREVGDTKLAEQLVEALRQIENVREDHQRIVEVLFDQPLGARDIVVALHEIPDSPDARFLESVFAQRLVATDASDPVIMRVLIDNHLRANEFADALALIELMNAEDAAAPRTMFRRAWCNLALGRHDQAKRYFEQLSLTHPDDAWASIGQQLGNQVDEIDGRVGQTADAVFGAISTVREGVGALEAELTISRASDPVPISIAIAARPKQNALEIVSREGDQVTAAYRCGADSTAVYMHDDPVIYESPVTALWPVPYVSVVPTPDGDHRFQYSVRVGQGTSDVAKANLPALSSALMSVIDGIQQLVVEHMGRGWTPGPITEDDQGSRTFTWLRPDPELPELEEVRFTIRSDGTLGALDVSHVDMHRLHYTQSEDVVFDLPDWPEAETKAISDASRFEQLFLRWCLHTAALFRDGG